MLMSISRSGTEIIASGRGFAAGKDFLIVRIIHIDHVVLSSRHPFTALQGNLETLDKYSSPKQPFPVNIVNEIDTNWVELVNPRIGFVVKGEDLVFDILKRHRFPYV